MEYYAIFQLHLVHWNCGKYSSPGEAAGKPDGLAVLGMMIEVGNGINCKGYVVLYTLLF